MGRFLISDSILRNKRDLAIIQTIKPEAIIECIEGHSTCKEPYRQYTYTNIHGQKVDWTLRIHFIVNGFEQDPTIIDQLTKRAWRVYRLFMEENDRKMLNSNK